MEMGAGWGSPPGHSLTEKVPEKLRKKEEGGGDLSVLRAASKTDCSQEGRGISEKGGVREREK